MPRANRNVLPGHVWHITRRCHGQRFLLKFRKDRRRWLHWLYQARQRYGLCVLNYMVTCNHVHLLVRDRGAHEIAAGMQLVAGRTAQEFNARKGRRGSFWEDRYHATAVQTGTHLMRCMAYIDLNMVRAGVVAHPAQWPCCGYHEIQAPPQRYRVIDRERLAEVLGLPGADHLRDAQRSWVETALDRGCHAREPQWSERVAVGSVDFVESIRAALPRDRRGQAPRRS